MERNRRPKKQQKCVQNLGSIVFTLQLSRFVLSSLRGAIVEAWMEISRGSTGASSFARFLRVAKLQRVVRIQSGQEPQALRPLHPSTPARPA
eukprot:6194536-Amphidinium_carterae.1